MDNKLSELSKPVAWTDAGELRDLNKHGCAYIYIIEPVSPYHDPRRKKMLYSQEYVSALLAELEAKDKRIAELEQKLATPVRLPRPSCTYADHSYPAYSRKQVEEILTSAGMCFTVEGDE